MDRDTLRHRIVEALRGGELVPALHDGFPALRRADRVLGIECGWRIVRDGLVVVGTGYDGDTKAEAFQALTASPLRAVDVSAPHYELTLTFGAGRLETFADAAACWWLDVDGARAFTVGAGFVRGRTG